MTTALENFERLECSGLWRPAGEGQRREVLVRLGHESLILADMTDTPLVHWALADVARLSPAGAVPAIYGPRGFETETLEIDEPLMIAAIEELQRRLGRARRRRGRLRRLLAAFALLALLAAGPALGPPLLVDQAARIVPAVSRRQTGEAMLRVIAARLGPPCDGIESRPVLAALTRTLATVWNTPAPREDAAEETVEAPPPLRIEIMPDLPVAALALPGRIFLVHRRLIEEADGPAALAAALAAAEAATRPSPFHRLLAAAGPLATLRLFLDGHLPPDAIRIHALELISAEEPGEPAAAPGSVSPPPLPVTIDDRDWLILQNICRE